MAFGIIEGPEFRGGFVQFCNRLLVPIQQPHLPCAAMGKILFDRSRQWVVRTCVAGEDRAATFSLIPDNPTHLDGCVMGR